MKFHEVQEALEAGKKITRKAFYGKNLVKSPLLAVATFEYSIIEYKFSYLDITADDWEIIEDIREVKVEYKPYFRCPSCDCDNTNFAYYKEGWTCKKCGQVVKLIVPDPNKEKL